MWLKNCQSCFCPWDNGFFKNLTAQASFLTIKRLKKGFEGIWRGETMVHIFYRPAGGN